MGVGNSLSHFIWVKKNMKQLITLVLTEDCIFQRRGFRNFMNYIYFYIWKHTVRALGVWEPVLKVAIASKVVMVGVMTIGDQETTLEGLEWVTAGAIWKNQFNVSIIL